MGLGSCSLMQADQCTSIPFETRHRRGLCFADANVRVLVHENWQPFRDDVMPKRHIEVLLKVRTFVISVYTVSDSAHLVAKQLRWYSLQD